ncbi:hypothetical protein FQW43_20865 [Salmonella enterica subsp. enterica serovar Enteritidis]|nr:hypothetical protein [Salmonella enterica subsp. enterica serovar Enteritidis]EDL7788497.1 hypothetical protein [Salmonella enterica]EDV3837769.1 hypothetical protein [Salmonella enterica subsp. diarizonae]EEL3820814.1 hypothetical protein [Salmonella enterica]EIB6553544.1 hypothetical protein [Salmonella enterica]
MPLPNPLPNRAYYSFPDVLEHLKRDNINCSMSDLLHFALIGSIETMIYIAGEWEHSGESHEGLALFKSSYGSHSNFFIMGSEHSIEIKSNLVNFSISQEDNNNQEKHHLFASIEGFMILSPFNSHNFFTSLTMQGEANLSDAIAFADTGRGETHCFEPNKNIAICFIDEMISPHDLYITHKEFEILKTGGRDAESCIVKNTQRKPHLPSSPKTLNQQAKVIRTLIEAIGGKHAANHPRNAIDNRNSELNKKLDLAGVKLPVSGVTVEKWLKGID